MTNGVRELLLRPDQWRKLVDDPSLIPNAVDECLRFSPSVIVWRRRALADAEVGGVKIPKGSNLLLLLGSANRDEAVFKRRRVVRCRRARTPTNICRSASASTIASDVSSRGWNSSSR